MSPQAPERQILIAPSILPADFSRLGDEIERVVEAGADRIHWDVMDGVFVPNLTIGPPVITSCRALTSTLFEAHLMVADPDPFLHDYVAAGCDLVIVHAEACRHLHRTLGAIRELGVRAGVSLNPATPPEAIRSVLDLLDHVLVMTVNPGFGGQAYLSSMEPKIETIRRWIDDAGTQVDIEVDGGISEGTVADAAAAGANVFVAGTAVFRHPDGMGRAVSALRERAISALPTASAAHAPPAD